MSEDYDELVLPDLDQLIDDMRQTYRFFREYDDTHSFELVCILDMAVYVMGKLNRDDPSDIWESIVHNMRWLASFGLMAEEDEMRPADRAVLKAIVAARGDALGEAMLAERFASVGMTATAQ